MIIVAWWLLNRYFSPKVIKAETTLIITFIKTISLISS